MRRFISSSLVCSWSSVGLLFLRASRRKDVHAWTWFVSIKTSTIWKLQGTTLLCDTMSYLLFPFFLITSQVAFEVTTIGGSLHFWCLLTTAKFHCYFRRFTSIRGSLLFQVYRMVVLKTYLQYCFPLLLSSLHLTSTDPAVSHYWCLALGWWWSSCETHISTLVWNMCIFAIYFLAEAQKTIYSSSLVFYWPGWGLQVALLHPVQA